MIDRINNMTVEKAKELKSERKKKKKNKKRDDAIVSSPDRYVKEVEQKKRKRKDEASHESSDDMRRIKKDKKTAKKNNVLEDKIKVHNKNDLKLKKQMKKEQKKARKLAKKEKKRKEISQSSPEKKNKKIDNPHELPGIVTSSAKYPDDDPNAYEDTNGVTLLLFYQYVEPPWTPSEYQKALQFGEESASSFDLTGRMRIAREGFNCTLTGTFHNIRSWCTKLRTFSRPHFEQTEFKLTDHLPDKQRFPKLNCFHVQELVHYGLTGSATPDIDKTGVHLEPQDYHNKMKEDDTVIIDVRNHYEAAIGHFNPPEEGAQMIDPKMRKSTEFPIWLDKPETKKKLKGKQVLMYCTGGVRCGKTIVNLFVSKR